MLKSSPHHQISSNTLLLPSTFLTAQSTATSIIWTKSPRSGTPGSRWATKLKTFQHLLRDMWTFVALGNLHSCSLLQKFAAHALRQLDEMDLDKMIDAVAADETQPLEEIYDMQPSAELTGRIRVEKSGRKKVRELCVSSRNRPGQICYGVLLQFLFGCTSI